ncbi:MAG TPA: hypothetical protein VF510_12975, partial [Ktedonobacterales bacterium]
MLYKQSSVAVDAITQAGGTLVYSYSQIGVAIARSDNPTFAADISSNGLIEGAAATSGFATQLNDNQDAGAADAPVTPATPAPGMDNLSGLQWDMAQIHAFEAHAISGGSPSVTVGDIDTGLDFTHPDLAPNVDFANSVSCIGGIPNQS